MSNGSGFGAANMKTRKLADLCSDVLDCPHSTPKWLTSGVRVIRNFNIKDGALDFTNGFYVDEDTYQSRIKRGAPEAGDIVISREAPMGVAALVPDGLKCCLGQRLVLLKVDRTKCDPRYLLFAFMSDYVQTQFRRADATGSTVSNLAIPDLKEIRIPIAEGQAEIGELLDLVQSSILLNKQINDNLLEMAHAVYMHLFFRRTPNAKLGEILIEHPKSTVQVGDAKNAKGRFPFFTSGDSILRWNESIVDGRFCLLNTGGNADVKFYAGEAAYSTDTWCISAKEGMTDYLYTLLHTIRRELDQKFFTGTGLKHLQKPLLKERPIYKPSQSEIKEFNELAVPTLTQISENLRENNVLTGLRDWLLPMLMNGQATVRLP